MRMRQKMEASLVFCKAMVAFCRQNAKLEEENEAFWLKEAGLSDSFSSPHSKYCAKSHATLASPRNSANRRHRGAGSHCYPIWSTPTGKLSALIWPFTSVQKQST
jgi:hypothetical protein